jgi:hypothetical protein
MEEGLWSFARVKGVEPTNNAVERALRHAVLWRRIVAALTAPGKASGAWSPSIPDAAITVTDSHVTLHPAQAWDLVGPYVA